MNVEDCIRRAAAEAQDLLNELYAAGEPAPKTALDQVGLRDGLSIVEEYLQYGEPGLALEHLHYMVDETSLKLSRDSLDNIQRANDALGMSRGASENWSRHCDRTP